MQKVRPASAPHYMSDSRGLPVPRDGINEASIFTVPDTVNSL